MKLWKKYARQQNIDSEAIALKFIIKAKEERLELENLNNDLMHNQEDLSKLSTKNLRTHPVNLIVKNAYKLGSQVLFEKNEKSDVTFMNMAGDSLEFLSEMRKRRFKLLKIEDNPLLQNKNEESTFNINLKVF